MMAFPSSLARGGNGGIAIKQLKLCQKGKASGSPNYLPVADEDVVDG